MTGFSFQVEDHVQALRSSQDERQIVTYLKLLKDAELTDGDALVHAVFEYAVAHDSDAVCCAASEAFCALCRDGASEKLEESLQKFDLYALKISSGKVAKAQNFYCDLARAFPQVRHTMLKMSLEGSDSAVRDYRCNSQMMIGKLFAIDPDLVLQKCPMESLLFRAYASTDKAMRDVYRPVVAEIARREPDRAADFALSLATPLLRHTISERPLTHERSLIDTVLDHHPSPMRLALSLARRLAALPCEYGMVFEHKDHEADIYLLGLMAQRGPHFVHNILNVALKAMDKQDEKSTLAGLRIAETVVDAVPHIVSCNKALMEKSVDLALLNARNKIFTVSCRVLGKMVGESFERGQKLTLMLQTRGAKDACSTPQHRQATIDYISSASKAMAMRQNPNVPLHRIVNTMTRRVKTAQPT